MTNLATTTQDPYASSDYNDTNVRLPKIQALRGEKGDIDCGYFVSEKEMEKAGWKAVRAKDLITYDYGSGNQEKGILLKNPRMLVVVRSPLFAIDRQLSQQDKALRVAGVYDRTAHGDRSIYNFGRYYEVLPLDQDNQPLSVSGFGYLAKGANCASFSQSWEQLVGSVTALHAEVNNIPVKPKNSIFSSLCVFQFSAKRELAGGSMKSFACKVGSHVTPTIENWEKYFLGRSADAGRSYLDILTPSEPNMLCLPEARAIEGEIVT
jgi:Family of unknown function (DUF5895)